MARSGYCDAEKALPSQSSQAQASSGADREIQGMMVPTGISLGLTVTSVGSKLVASAAVAGWDGMARNMARRSSPHRRAVGLANAACVARNANSSGYALILSNVPTGAL